MIDNPQPDETIKRLLAPIEEDMETLADQLLEEILMEKVIERGIERGRREALLRVLRKRFGELSEGDVARVDGAKIPTLDAWTDRVLTARTLDEVWGSYSDSGPTSVRSIMRLDDTIV